MSARLAGCVEKDGCVADLWCVAVVEGLELENFHCRAVRESGHDFELSTHCRHVPPQRADIVIGHVGRAASQPQPSPDLTA